MHAIYSTYLQHMHSVYMRYIYGMPVLYIYVSHQGKTKSVVELTTAGLSLLLLLVLSAYFVVDAIITLVNVSDHDDEVDGTLGN